MIKEENKQRFRQAIEIVATKYFKAHGRTEAELQDFFFSLSLDEMDAEQLMAVLFLTVQIKVDIL
jgi:hypothetical protein